MKKSRLLGILCMLITTQCFTVSQAFASLIILSGDSNLGNALYDNLGPSAANPNNATWFSNVLGSGTTVKVQNDSVDGSVIISASAIDFFYNTQSGVTSSLLAAGTTINDTLLAGVDLYIGMLPSNDYTVVELNALSDYLAGGGSVFFMGDGGFLSSNENTRINSALTFLGSSLSIVDADLDIDSPWSITTNIDADSINAGVSNFTYSYTSKVSGGASLIRSLDNSTFVAYEGSVVPVPAALWLFGSGLIGLIGLARRKT